MVQQTCTNPLPYLLPTAIFKNIFDNHFCKKTLLLDYSILLIGTTLRPSKRILHARNKLLFKTHLVVTHMTKEYLQLQKNIFAIIYMFLIYKYELLMIGRLCLFLFTFYSISLTFLLD